MNRVFVVRKDKIEKIEMAENLSHLVSIVSKPVNSKALSKLNKNRNNNVDNPWLKRYYDEVLRFNVIGRKFSDGTEYFHYVGLENVLGGWSNKIRHAMTIVANECGEKDVANYVKPSSGVSVDIDLTSLYSCESFSLKTFNIISVPSDEDEAKLIVKDNDIERHVSLKDGDIVLIADEETLKTTTVKTIGRGEILSVRPLTMFRLDKIRDERIEDYLNSKTQAKNHIDNLITAIEDVLAIPVR